MKASEIRDLSPEEIQSRLDEAREKYFRLRFQLASGQLKNTANLRQARRDIARLATILRQREREQV
ncbi:MAG TPA: 50S ribosomal protein L29 [Anaerolineales bacterium]|nr:50S ribosomal protein L29 [Anaerolineales bacterium]